MKVKIKFDVHCYRGGRLADDLFDSTSLYFIGKTEGEKIKKNRYAEFIFSYDSKTTLDDFRRKVLFELFDGEEYSCEILLRIVGKNNWLFYIDNSKETFESILLDAVIPNCHKEILVKVFVSFNAGTFSIENNLRYFMHSNENGLEPHVHVNVLGTNYSVSIPISHPKDYVGNMPNKYLKKAMSRVKDDKNRLLEFWNTNTNGLKVNINEAFGIIEY